MTLEVTKEEAYSIQMLGKIIKFKDSYGASLMTVIDSCESIESTDRMGEMLWFLDKDTMEWVDWDELKRRSK